MMSWSASALKAATRRSGKLLTLLWIHFFLKVILRPADSWNVFKFGFWGIVSVLFSFVGVAVPAKHVLVGEVIKGSPAEKAGIKTGDVIETLNGQVVDDPAELVSLTKKHLGSEITLQVQNQQKERVVKVTPRKTYPKNQGPIGVAITPNFEIKKYPIWEAPFVGTKEVYLRGNG